MKLSTRLAAGFSLLVLLLVLCAGVALHALNNAREGMDDAVNVKMKKYQLILDMRGSIRDMAIAVRNLALLTDPKAMQPEWERLEKQKRLYIQNREQLSQMMAIDSVSEGRAAFRKVLDSEDAALSSYEKAGRLGLQNLQEETTTYLMNVTRPAQNQLLGALNAMTNVQMQNSRNAVANNSADIRRISVFLSVLVIVSIALAAVTG
ncbi:MCP four helix bundle domain-containing protein, partial [Mixta calida]